MKKFFFKIFTSLVLCFFGVGPVFAQYGIGVTAGKASIEKKSIPYLIGQGVGIILSMVGIIFFALMIYGGITWMTSGGAEDRKKKAVSIITGAIIGIVITLSAYILVSYVFEKVG